MSTFYFEHRVTKRREYSFVSENRDELESHWQTCYKCRLLLTDPDFTLVEIDDAASCGYDREAARFASGTYSPVPWRNEPFWVDHHHAHLSTEDPALVAYTPNPEYAARDRQLRVRPGRYLTSLGLDNELVKFWVASFDEVARPPVLKLATTAAEIEAVYLNGPDSCMSHEVDDYRTDGIHPVRAYAAGDLAVAYLGNAETRVTARAVVWPAMHVYGRPYGDEARLMAALKTAGYEPGSFSGARLAKLYAGKHVIAPYLDMPVQVVRVEADHLVIDPNGGHPSVETCGLLNVYTCHECSEPIARVDVHHYDDETYCPFCYEELFAECDSCGDTVDVDELTSYHDESYCQRCADRYLYSCPGCNEQVDRRSGRRDSGDYWHHECHEEAHFECEGCNRVANVDERHLDEDDRALCDDCFEATQVSEAAD